VIEAVTVRQAEGDRDVATVAAMWNRAATWLRSRGSDQWQYPVRRDNITRAIDAGACWLAERAGDPLGTITVDTDADPHYWWPEDDPSDALYVHRMVVEGPARGCELGSALLDWAARRAQRDGRTWLRLDAWKSNPGLHRYYLARGFHLVRVIEDPDDPSGACMQRPAALQLGGGPRITEAESTAFA